MAVVPKLLRVVSAIDLEAQVNAYLAPFFAGASVRVLGVGIDSRANTPFFGANFVAAITTDVTGAVSQAAPFQFLTFTAPSESEVLRLCNAYITSNPTFFFSQIFSVYRPEDPDPSQGVTLGIFFCSDATPAAANWGSIASSISGGGSSYLNAAPTTAQVGGITVGSTFPVATSMQVMWDLALHPYISPTFSAFAISGESTSQEVGDQIPAAITFTWSTTTPGNIQANSIDIIDVTGGNIVLAAGLANDGGEAVVQGAPVSRVTPGSYQYKIQALDTLLNAFNRTLTFTWFFRRYAGAQAAATLTEAQIEALTISALATGYAGTYATPAGGFKYICFANSVGGQINSVKDSDTLLNVPFATSADNAAYSNIDGGGFSFALVSVTNAFGVTDNYRVYRTQNALGAAVTLLVT